jgi:hypothetical protein
MYLRIGSLELTPANGYGIAAPDFGKPGAPDRTFAVTVRIYGTTDADYRAKVAALAVELCREEVLIVAYTAGGSMATAICLRGHGKQPWEEPYTVRAESRHFAEVFISLAVAPATNNANRVYLAQPFGDDFPVSADVVANDEDKAFADGGRYAILAKTGDTYGTLTLYGDCTATELLVVENTYQNVSPAAATFTGTLTWLAVGGGAVGTEVKAVAYATAGTGILFHKALYRVPATAVRFKIAYAFSAGIAGDALAYIWGVHVGEQVPACPMTPPYYLHSGADHWEHTTWPEHEFSRTTTGNCAWTHNTHYTIATCTHNAAQANFASLHYHPVIPNRRYGYRCSNQVTGFNSGQAQCVVWWYDQDLNYIGTSIPRSRAADDGAVVETFVEVIAPEYAFYAVPGACVDINSHLVFKVSAIQFGPHVMEV